MNMRLPSAIAIAVLAATGVQAQETIRLTLATGITALAPVNVEVERTFIPAVAAELERLGGNYEIDWTVGHGGSIVRLPAIFSAVADGVVDIGVTTQALHQSQVPHMNVVFQTPFNDADHRISSEVLDQVVEEVPAARAAFEREGVHLLTSWAFDRYILMSTVPLESIDDFDGLRIGGIGPNLSWVQAGGAVGVVASFATVYNDMQSGVYEAMLSAPMGSLATRLHEVAPYIVDPGIGAMAVNVLIFNDARWAGLPEEVKAAIEVGVEAWEEAYLARVDAGLQASLDAMQGEGATLIEWTSEEQARWADALPPLAADWAEAQGGQSGEARETLEAYVRFMEEAGVTFARDWTAE